MNETYTQRNKDTTKYSNKQHYYVFNKTIQIINQIIKKQENIY